MGWSSTGEHLVFIQRNDLKIGITLYVSQGGHEGRQGNSEGPEVLWCLGQG